MDAVLCNDVLILILGQYGASHVPLWTLAQRHWHSLYEQQQLVVYTLALGTNGIRPYPLKQLARGNCKGLLCWIRQRRKSVSGKDWSVIQMREFLGAAARGGHLDLVKSWLHKWNMWKNETITRIMTCAARGGHASIIQLCKDILYPRALRYRLQAIAARDRTGDFERYQRIEQARHPSDVAAANLRAMESAAKGGHDDIVQKCYNNAFVVWHIPAAPAFEWWHDQVARSLRVTLVNAAYKGHTSIVRMCVEEWGQRKYVDLAFAEAARGGHEDIVRLCHDTWGATDVNYALDCAASEGHETIVQMCKEWLNTRS